jgi:Ca-activated chloride channel family protein
MSGDKIEYTKRSVLKLIDHLREEDVAGIVTFSSNAHCLVPPGRLTDEKKNEIRRAVQAIVPSGGTNFADGMLLGCKLVNDLDLPEGVLHRVIMFTDGQANVGPATKIDDVRRLFEANKGRVSASAFGYGRDVLGDFLTEFARTGQGNYAFIRDPDGALTAFGTELGGLLSTYGTSINLVVSPYEGHDITSVVSDVDSDEDVTGVVTIKIPDILAEETRHVVLATTLGKQKVHGPRAVNAFDVKVVYDMIDRDGKKDRHTSEVKGKVQFVKNGEEQKTPSADIDKIVALAQVVRAQIEAEEKAKKGDYGTAAQIMYAAAAATSSRGHDGAARLAARVRETVSNREVYTVSGNYLGSVRAGGTRGMGVASYEVSALSDLSGAGVNSVTNSSQLHFATQFQQGAAMPPTPPVDAADIVNIALNVPNTVVNTQQSAVLPNTVNAGWLAGQSFTEGYAGLGHQTIGVSMSPGNSADIARMIADLQVAPPPPVAAVNPPSKPSTEPSKSKKRTKSKNGW